MLPDTIIAISGLLLLTGAFSSKISSRFNLPTLLLFLAAGIITEPLLPLTGKAYSAQINFFGIVAMAYILYSGGLETNWQAVRQVALRGLLLAVPGVFITALITGVAAYLIFGMTKPFLWCFLLGALISSTDAAAVFGILRGQSINLKGNLQQLLEFESGSNDPMAAFLTLTIISTMSGSAESVAIETFAILYKLGAGVIAGIGFGMFGKQLFRVRLEYEGLYFVISVSLVLVCYGLTQLIEANGFMACYTCGITMNGTRFNYKKGLTKFHNGLAWLMQVGLFIVLGFLAEPELLKKSTFLIRGLGLGLLLIFLARPLSVFICLTKSNYNFREKILISWVGIRGAAPIVLATFPLAMGIRDAEDMFGMIFFMVVLSMMLQGWLLMPVAKMLNLATATSAPSPPSPLELEITQMSKHQEMREFEITADSPFAGKTLAEIALPEDILVTMLRRGNTFVAPRGNTMIEAGDGMMIIAEHARIDEISKNYFTRHSAN